MDLASARAIAERRISDLQNRIGVELVMLENRTREFDLGWVFFYNSAKYQVTRSFRDSLAGNSPIIISKLDGSVHTTGTARPVEYYIEEFRRKHSGQS